GGRSPLNALPKQNTYTFSREDSAIIDDLERLTGGEIPAVLVIEADDLSALLRKLKEHPRISVGKSTQITVSGVPWIVTLNATMKPTCVIVLSIRRFM